MSNEELERAAANLRAINRIAAQCPHEMHMRPAEEAFWHAVKALNKIRDLSSGYEDWP